MTVYFWHLMLIFHPPPEILMTHSASYPSLPKVYVKRFQRRVSRIVVPAHKVDKCFINLTYKKAVCEFKIRHVPSLKLCPRMKQEKYIKEFRTFFLYTQIGYYNK